MGELLVFLGILLLAILAIVLFFRSMAHNDSNDLKMLVVILIAFLSVTGGLSIIQTDKDANRGAPRLFDLDDLTATTFAVRTDSHVLFCSENLRLPNAKGDVVCFRNPIGEFRKKDLKKLPYAKTSCGPWIDKLPKENEHSSDKLPLAVLDSFYTECP